MSRRWRNLRIRHGQTWGPGLGQANQGQAWPTFTRQAGSIRFAARLLPSRRRRYDPPWVVTAAPPLQFVRQAGSQRVPARLLPSQRRRFDPGWTPQPAAVFTLGEPYFQWATGTPYLS